MNISHSHTGSTIVKNPSMQTDSQDDLQRKSDTSGSTPSDIAGSWVDPAADGQSKIRLSAASIKGQANTGACDACRIRKVRCIANENALSSKCQRCVRSNRECVYTTHSKTRRRKRTDTRVKELEEKVRGLSMLLEGKTLLESVPENKFTNLDRDSEVEGVMTGEAFSPRNDDDNDYPSELTHYQDVIKRGIVTLEMAEKLFDRYISELMPLAPAVIISCSFTKLREEKPALFLAVLAAGAGASEPTLNLRLNQEIQHLYATRIAIRGHKSLELVQALCVSILWTYPPKRTEELKFHQEIHMAATMAMDLGLGRRPKASMESANPAKEIYAATVKEEEGEAPLIMDRLIIREKSRADSGSVEGRRALLACYIFCTGVAMSLRLPNMLRFTSWMADCIEYLETSPEAALSDKLFASWVKLQHIAEEAAINLGLDSDEYVSLEEERVQLLVKSTEKQMEAWRKEATARGFFHNAVIETNYHVNQIYIHEIALHADHDAEDFKPPFSIISKRVSQFQLTPPYLNAILLCISSSEALLNTFLNLEVNSVRCLPTLTYARAIYTLVVLLKLSVSLRSPSNNLIKVLDPQDVKADHYLLKCLERFKAAADLGNNRVHVLSAQFATVLSKLQTWYQTLTDRRKSLQEQDQSPKPIPSSSQQTSQSLPPSYSQFLASPMSKSTPTSHPNTQSLDFSTPPTQTASHRQSSPMRNTSASANKSFIGTLALDRNYYNISSTSKPDSHTPQLTQTLQQPLPDFDWASMNDSLFAPFDFPMEVDQTEDNLFKDFVNSGGSHGWMTDSNGLGYEALGMGLGSNLGTDGGAQAFSWSTTGAEGDANLAQAQTQAGGYNAP